ncbi:MAG: DNA replication complex GINS family protein [Nitrososphaeraceae archaeon]|nr:DNA replication complex GINS family protein [Nitrososphaeraceae archaeon]
MNQSITVNNINNIFGYDGVKDKIEFVQKFYYIKYLMEDVRITFKKNFSINIINLFLEAKDGEIASIPRWLAKILESNRYIEIQDIDFLVYVSRSLNRERISKPHDLSGIDVDFYIRVNDYIQRLKENEKESLLVSLNSFVASRIEKIVKLAAASSLSIELEKKLSAEEKELYNFVHNLSSSFKKIAVKRIDRVSEN